MAYILDSLSASPVAVYGLRRLVNGYSGNAIKVRESNTNTEADIGFDGDDLDTTALLSHCGSYDGFIVTWYDQSGNNYDATQSTTGNQPQIVSGGSVLTDGGDVARIAFDGSNSRMTVADNNDIDLNGDLSTNYVITNRTSGTYQKILSKGGGAGAYMLGFENSNKLSFTISGIVAIESDTTVSDTSSYILDTIRTAGSPNTYDFYKNGSINTKTNSSSITDNTTALVIGSKFTYGTDSFNGSLQELILFNSALSDDDRRYLETNQADYFGITHADPLYPSTEVTVPLATLTITTFGAEVTTGALAVDIEVGLATLTFTTFNASVEVGVGITVPIATLIFTTFNANVETGINVESGINILSLTTFNASVELGINITPNVGILSFTTFDASVETGVGIEVGLLEMSFTTFDASITVNGDVEIIAPLYVMSLTTFNADVGIGVNIECNLLELSVNTFNANVEQGINILSGISVLSPTTFNASIEQGISVTIPLKVLTITTFDAETQTSVDIVVGLLNLNITTFDAVVSDGNESRVEVIVGLKTLTIVTFAPWFAKNAVYKYRARDRIRYRAKDRIRYRAKDRIRYTPIRG